MTLLTQEGDVVACEPLLAIALDAFERTIAALNAQVRIMEDGAFVSPRTLERLTSDAGTAFRVAFEERKKIEEFRRKETAAQLGYALDFEQARSEVGRRLDRLRASRDAD